MSRPVYLKKRSTVRTGIALSRGENRFPTECGAGLPPDIGCITFYTPCAI